VIGLGHPDGAPSVYASPGVVQSYLEFSDIYGGNKDEIPQGMDVHRKLIHAGMNTRKGDSGGPVIDLSGAAVGWTDLEGHGTSSDATPIAPMQALLRKNE
jgi:hypothetical protein